jgi:uncharacterized membrane protein YozB (DUF420 family)
MGMELIKDKNVALLKRDFILAALVFGLFFLIYPYRTKKKEEL